MRIPLFILLLLLSGCSAAPLEISEKLSLDSPEMLIIDTTPPQSVSLKWAPQPIDEFIISQNADGFSGRNDYRDFAVGRLISTRVEDYIGTVSSIVDDSDNQATITIESVNLNYKFRLKKLAYAKLLVNAEITANRKSKSKIYYRQTMDPPKIDASKVLESLFDEVAIEIGQDILSTLAR